MACVDVSILSDDDDDDTTAAVVPAAPATVQAMGAAAAEVAPPASPAVVSAVAAAAGPAVSLDSDEEDDAPIAQAAAAVAASMPAACGAGAAEVGIPKAIAPTGLRSVVIAQLDLNDSDDECMVQAAAAADGAAASAPPAPGVAAAPGPAVAGAAAPPAQGAGPAEPTAATAAGTPVASPSTAPASAAKIGGIDADVDPARTSSDAAAPARKRSGRPSEESSLPGPPAKKAGKADTNSNAKTDARADAKDRKLSKEEMEGRVLEYMQQQNRPYNSQNVFDNLHGAVPKNQVQLCLDTLTGAGRITMKEYGKLRTYLAAQAASNEDVDEETANLQADTDAKAALRGDLKARTDEAWKAVAVVRGRLGAADEAAEAISEAAQLEQRVKATRTACEDGEGAEQVDTSEVAAVEKDNDIALALWRARKRLCMDILRSFSEMSNAKVSQLTEKYGVDTDEECNQLLPEVAAK